MKLFKDKAPDAVLYYASALGFDEIAEVAMEGVVVRMDINKSDEEIHYQAAILGNHLEIPEDAVHAGADVNMPVGRVAQRHERGWPRPPRPHELTTPAGC